MTNKPAEAALLQILKNTQVVNRPFFQFVRGVSNKTNKNDALRHHEADKNSNILLADALNLIAPKSEVKNTYNYKPSIINHLRKGSAQEQYDQYTRETTQKQKTKVDHQMNHLMEDLRVLYGVKPRSNYDVVDLSVLEIKKHIRLLTKESQIIDLIKVLYYQDKLLVGILNECMFNKHLRNLNELPVNVESLGYDFMIRNKWSRINYIQFNIVLMKKLRDCGETSGMLRNLEANFKLNYLPLIENNTLGPFYERIIWRMYFQYRDQLKQETHDELYFIKKLDYKNALMIWQTSPTSKHHQLSAFISLHFDDKFNILQRLFWRLCNHKSVQTIIEQDIQNNGSHSALLIDLKKFTVKHRLHSILFNLENMDAKTRSQFYLSVNGMESIIELMNKDLQPHDILKELRQIRQDHVLKALKLEPTPADSSWSWVSSFMNSK